jgi:hypothetical protein
MRPVIRNLVVAGFILLLGTPMVATILAFLQRPSESSGSAKSIGETLSTVLVANFACIPFMAIGMILLLIGLVMARNAGNGQPAAR